MNTTVVRETEKSSMPFTIRVTRADVKVQPYVLKTKSPFVGHMDYKYLRWQVVDNPGILNHSLEERKTIEMQAITAFAHLRAAILYVMDISEQCGHTLEEQMELFNGIKPLFVNKPLLVILNKIDVLRPDELSEEKKELMKVFDQEAFHFIKAMFLTTDVFFYPLDIELQHVH
ncbi:GTP-binding protein 4-like [Porites lutea]|uniref:GTP-binding protein 4-like n=1 Tax=Porites lutea TaxID=51062 RepID=UPI003CC607E7